MDANTIKDNNRKRLEAKRNQLVSGSESVKNVQQLVSSIASLTKELQSSGIKETSVSMQTVGNELSKVAEAVKNSNKQDIAQLTNTINGLINTLKGIEVKPQVNIPKTEVNVDLSPVISALKEVKSSISSIELPKQQSNSDIVSAVKAVNAAISGLQFPVPNYVMPYSQDGKGVQVVLDGSGNVPISGSISVDTTGLATDANQTNGAQKTQIVDAGGEQATVTGGKLDVNASIDTTGLATSAKQDTGNTSVASIDTKTPALGQALAAASVPVILPSATITTLTPPAAITGFATSALQSTQDASINTLLKPANTLAGVTTVSTVTNLSQLGGAAVPIGAGTEAAAIRVTLPTNGTGKVGATLDAETTKVIGTVRVASGGIASGAVASGAFASGSVASGALASGAVVDITNVSTPITPAAATATKAIASGAEYRSTLPTWTNTQQGAMQVGTRGSLHTELWNTDSATPVPSGSGNATGALRVELANNGTGLVGLNAGTNNIGDVDVLTLPVAFNSGATSATTQRTITATDAGAAGRLAANSGVDIGDVDVTSMVSATLDHGSNRDIDTAAEQITATSFACKFGVTLKADAANTGILYIGNSDVTAGTTAATDGFPLSPGESLTLEVTNSNIPYAIASANNQVVYWVAV